jgi:hypothetical protein
MRKRRTIILVATAFAVCALLVVLALRPGSPPFNVSVIYIGYTNDSFRAPWLGTTNAPAFAIRNLSRWPVLRTSCSWIHSGPPGPLAGFSQIEDLGLPDSNILKPGESEVVTVPPQTNHTRWAVTFSFINEGAQARVRKTLLKKGEKWGLTKYKQGNYCVTSDEVKQ